MSPRHAWSVALVLNPRTGLVSPQWHVKFDDDFATVGEASDETHGLWKLQAGFDTVGVRDPESRIRPQVQDLRNSNFCTMAENGPFSQPDIMAMEAPAPADSVELLPAPPEGDMVQGDPGYDIDFGASDLGDYTHNMEFGTRLDDDTVASSLGGDDATLRRSNRLRKPSWKVRDNIEQGEIALPAAYEVLATYRLGLGHVAQAAHQDQGNLQVEGQVEHSWWTTRVWSKLLGDLLSSGNLGLDQTRPHFVNSVVLAYSANRLCAGLPASTH
jgi:hypothetical protein